MSDFLKRCKCLFLLVFIEETKFFSGTTKHPELQAMYVKTDEFVEKLTGMIHGGMLKWGIPLFTFPKAVISYATYFTTDAGRASFELPFHM